MLTQQNMNLSDEFFSYADIVDINYDKVITLLNGAILAETFNF